MAVHACRLFLTDKAHLCFQWIAPISEQVCVLMYLFSALCFPQASIKHRRGQFRSCHTTDYRVRFMSDSSGHHIVSKRSEILLQS